MAQHNLIWVLVAVSLICSSLLQHVQAVSWNYSTNPDDYDFSWLANGTWASGSEPYCTYCVNALTYDTLYKRSPADEARGLYWNLTVGTYRCDGVEPNEFWAYHEPTQTIVYGNLTQVLCIDAVASQTLGVLKLRDCNSSSLSQQWTKNGSRLVSGLQGQAGEQLFMVAAIPNKETNPTNQNNAYNVTLKSTLPSNLAIPGFSFTYDFTFLSRKNLADSSGGPLRFTTQGLLEITDFSRNELVNGGFERSTIQAGTDVSWNDWVQAQPSYFSMCGWVIDYGPIDYVKSGLLAPAEGSYSVHLNTHSDADHWGQVSQTIITDVGSEYVLSFYFTGFPPYLKIESRPTWQCSPTYKVAQLEVLIANSTSTSVAKGSLRSNGYGLQQNFSIGVTGSNSVTIASLWQRQAIKFRALTNVTTVSFRSLNFNNSCGPMIDAVALVRQKPQAFWDRTVVQVVIACVLGIALVSAILLGVYFGRRRYCVPEDYSGLYKTENARVFSVKELSSSTNRFSSVLGEGAFGTVYKADFPDGTTGAVKVEKAKEMHFRSSKVLASDEIAVLLRVHHRNLVNLTGFCIHKGRHYLVFEYLPNGSLYDRLHQSVIPFSGDTLMNSIELRRLSEHVIPWNKRTKIAADVAYGLEYLHHDADPPIVHRDVKSRNILLTATDSAKLADFGLSKAAPADATAFQSIETMVRGSIGYLDPQYFLTGVFSAKSDVYSYGVVLLEIISGHQAIYNAASLSSWAAPYMANPALYHELVDKKLNGKYDTEQLKALVELSKMCMQDDSRTRPNMRQVVAFLNAKQLVVSAGESSERVEDVMSREAYHKMHPVFIDFEALPVDSPTGSSDNIFVSPRARD